MTRAERLELFMAKVEPEPMSGCWLWMGAQHKQGYGWFWDGKSKVKAHRYSWSAFRGAISEGLLVCHRCDVEPCVNPAHLFTGTQWDNMGDAARKGRTASGDGHGARLHPESVPRGEAHRFAKLTAAAVREIRASSEHPTDMARRFGVSRVSISNARRRQTWKHLE